MAATPTIMRAMNQRTLLGVLRRAGSASRAQLAKEGGMSQPTAGKIVDEMLRAGWVREIEGGEEIEGEARRLGRPGQMVGLDDRTCRFAAVQLGVVHTRVRGVGLASPDSDQWDAEFATPTATAAWSHRLEQKTERLDLSPSEGVVLSVPGVVDEVSQRVLFSPNAHWTEGVDLPQWVQKVWRGPVVMVQEIRALAVGHLAADPSEKDFLLVDIGAGIGAASVIDGKLAQSPLPLSGEIGHTPVLGNKRACGCGATGCLETLVSRRGMMQSLMEHSRKKIRPDWPMLVNQVRDRGMPAWLGRGLDAAAIHIAGAMNMLGMRHVVVTGCLSELSGDVMDHLSKAVQQSAMWARFGEVTCIGAPRRRLAGMVAVGIDRLLLSNPDDSKPLTINY